MSGCSLSTSFPPTFLQPHLGRAGLSWPSATLPVPGLKSAFIARFVANLVRHRSKAGKDPQPCVLLDEIARAFTSHDFFETLALQCVVFDPARKILTLANAGLPYPVLFSARRGRCERLPVGGPLIFARFGR